jgi:hypothetical protein
MNTRSNQKEPAGKPAPTARYHEIESEGQFAIADQVRKAVVNILTKGGSVSATQLAKWGPDGTEFFFRVLRNGIAKQMSLIRPDSSVTAPAPARAGNAKPKTKAKISAVAKTNQPSQRTDASEVVQKVLPVSTARNWGDQQRNRWSTRSRAILHGLIIAVVLLAGAAVLSRLWGTLSPLLVQSIQNWR